MTKALRVLLIEDSESDAELLLRQLRQAGYDPTFERVQTAEGVATALDHSAWDIVVSDHGMPSFTGLDALKIVRERETDLPFIFVSGSIGEDIAVAAMRAGAQDYVMKGDLRRLAPAIAREIADSQVRRRERIAAEQLRATNEVLRSVFAASPLAIIATDPRGIVKAWNPAAKRLFGWSAAEVLGKMNPTISEAEREIDELRRDAALRGEAVVSLEAKMLCKDGNLVDVGLSLAATYAHSGEPDGLTVVLQDLTERKLLEAQYLQAQKMETIGQLAGGVAHDFNNLLTVISSYSELVIMTLPSDDQRRDDLREIRRASEKATTLTRQLLTFSRKQVDVRSVVDLNEVVNSAAGLLKRLIGEEIELTLHLSPDAGRIIADAGQIEQIIMNLVVNARDAMPDGGRIEILTRHADSSDSTGLASGEYAVLSVTDSGIGMDAATLARVFEPFFTTKGDRGTGLGLATVFAIVKRHGGTIRVDSAPGAGTRFRVYLPRTEERGTARRPTPSEAHQLPSDETVLVVDDDPNVRAVAGRALVAAGFSVLVARDGNEALRIAGQHHGPIHLLVTDVVMPGLSGPLLAERLTTARPEVKVLFTSGYTDEHMRSSQVVGANRAFIAKPYTPALLVQAANDALE